MHMLICFITIFFAFSPLQVWVLASGASRNVDQVISWQGCITSTITQRLTPPDWYSQRPEWQEQQLAEKLQEHEEEEKRFDPEGHLGVEQGGEEGRLALPKIVMDKAALGGASAIFERDHINHLSNQPNSFSNNSDVTHLQAQQTQQLIMLPSSGPRAAAMSTTPRWSPHSSPATTARDLRDESAALTHEASAITRPHTTPEIMRAPSQMSRSLTDRESSISQGLSGTLPPVVRRSTEQTTVGMTGRGRSGPIGGGGREEEGVGREGSDGSVNVNRPFASSTSVQHTQLQQLQLLAAIGRKEDLSYGQLVKALRKHHPTIRVHKAIIVDACSDPCSRGGHFALKRGSPLIFFSSFIHFSLQLYTFIMPVVF